MSRLGTEREEMSFDSARCVAGQASVRSLGFAPSEAHVATHTGVQLSCEDVNGLGICIWCLWRWGRANCKPFDQSPHWVLLQFDVGDMRSAMSRNSCWKKDARGTQINHCKFTFSGGATPRKPPTTPCITAELRVHALLHQIQDNLVSRPNSQHTNVETTRACLRRE